MANFKHPDERTGPTIMELSNSDPVTEPEELNDAKPRLRPDLVSCSNDEQ